MKDEKKNLYFGMNSSPQNKNKQNLGVSHFREKP